VKFSNDKNITANDPFQAHQSRFFTATKRGIGMSLFVRLLHWKDSIIIGLNYLCSHFVAIDMLICCLWSTRFFYTEAELPCVSCDWEYKLTRVFIFSGPRMAWTGI